jgi:hypothetical protein
LETNSRQPTMVMLTMTRERSIGSAARFMI